MKKLSILIAFILCVIISYSQGLTPVPRGNQNQIDQFKGVIQGLRGSILSVVDTTNNPLTTFYGSLTVLPTDAGKDTIPIWMSNGLHWIKWTAGTATNIEDTIWAELPIYVRIDSNYSPRRQILTLLHPDGIVTPGYVIWTGIGLNFIVTPALYYIGYRQFNSPANLVTLAPAPVSGTRSDLFIVDTLATASALTGAAGGAVPQTNPSSQLPLTSVPVNAGDTIPANIQLETVYDEHLAPPAEWIPTTTGTNTVDFDNTDFPYWGTKAAFVSTYTNGSALVFTKSGTPDTVTAGAILRGFISFNIPFTGQLQFQWYNGSTATSNSIAVSSGYGINPNNVNTYQIFAIPLNAFTFLPSSNNLFNKLVITFAGSDISGAGGLYLDRLQLQTGLLNIDQPPPPAWYLKGNAGTNAGSDFVGTTDNEPLMFKVNGVQAGLIGTTTTFNTSLGAISLPITSTGIKNTAVGGGALGLNTTGFNNTGLGYTTNYHNLIGNNNTAVGWAAIGWNRGDGNTAVGYSALNSTVSVVRDARHNTAIGFEALQNNGDHKFNIGLGIQAGQLSTTILGGVARDSTLYISTFTKNMYFRLDSAAGTAPSVIGKDTSGFWHVYANSGGTLQNAYDNSISAWDGFTPFIDGYNGKYPFEVDNISAATIRAIDSLDASHFSYIGIEPNSTAFASNTIFGNSIVSTTDTTARMDASNQVNISKHLTINPHYVKVYSGNIGNTDDSIVTFIMHVDSVASVDVNSIAYFDANHHLKRGHLAGGGGVYTASNGLTMSSSDVKLGGALTANTTITSAGFTLLVDGVSEAPALRSNTSGGIAIGGFSSGVGTGIYGESVSGAGGNFVVRPASTNTAVMVEQLSRFSTGTAANGIGLYSSYSLQTSTGSSGEPLRLLTKWTDATTASRTSAFEIYLTNSAAIQRKLAIAGNGEVTLDGYGSGANTGTATFSLSVDAGGNVIETAAGGGGGNTLYTANDAIASDRTVDLNGKILIFDEGGNGLIHIDPVTFNTSLNATDGTANSGLELVANSVGSTVLFNLVSSNGGNQVEITGEPITNTITHTAATSIFDGVLRLKGYTVATLPAGTQGDLAFVTDATTPTYNILLVGGGAVVTIAFYNGTNWVSH